LTKINRGELSLGRMGDLTTREKTGGKKPRFFTRESKKVSKLRARDGREKRRPTDLALWMGSRVANSKSNRYWEGLDDYGDKGATASI